MLGSKEDLEQEGITDETTEITVNMDQAVILFRAIQSLSVELKTSRESLLHYRKDQRDIKNGTSLPNDNMKKISEQLNIIDFTEKQIPYIVENLREAIIFLQKEEDSTIKGVQDLI